MGVIPTRMMPLGVAVDSSLLPYDAEVEYLVGATSVSGDFNCAYIDTGIDTGNTVGFEIDITRVNETSSDSVAFGTRYDSGNTRYFIGAQVGGKYYWGWNGRIDSQTLALNAKHTLGLNYLNSRTATFDGTSVGSLSGTYSSVKRLYFPAYNTAMNKINGTSSWRYHGGRISVGSTLVRDYRPVRVGTVGAWYDRISGELCESLSQITSFTPGPDK